MKIERSLLYQLGELVEKAINDGQQPMPIWGQQQSYWGSCEGTMVSSGKVEMDLLLDPQTTYATKFKFKITIEEVE